MIPLIETGGTPYEIGFDVGRGVRDQIQTAAASTRADYARSNDERVVERIGAYVVATEQAAPELIEELQGMAEGSGVPFAELFVMNATAELNQEVGRFLDWQFSTLSEHNFRHAEPLGKTFSASVPKLYLGLFRQPLTSIITIVVSVV